MLIKDLNQTLKRHADGQDIFKAIGDVGPAMGMIGTLIGLVQMLSNMDDPKQIGPAMAVALLTTLYGAILANMFALPIADKLAVRSREENTTKSLIIDALLEHSGRPEPARSSPACWRPTCRAPSATTRTATPESASPAEIRGRRSPGKGRTNVASRHGS